MSDSVTIPHAEYERLRSAAEELGDIAAYDAARAALAECREELVPASFANRLMDGEHPVRVFREMRGLSHSCLAERSGVNRVQIVDIEAGRRHGSVLTLKRLADALDVIVDDLIA
jgi:DNA-binding XRE family transcriptional regulator